MYKATVGEDFEFEIKDENGQMMLDGEPIDLDVRRTGEKTFHVIYKNRSFRISVLSREGKNFQLKVNGNEYAVNVEDRFDLLLQKLGMDLPGAGLLEDLKAPMPGLVLDIMVKEGDTVEKDMPLMVLEAMKMENVLKAPADGTISEIHVDKQQPVEKNQLLISFND